MFKCAIDGFIDICRKQAKQIKYSGTNSSQDHWIALYVTTSFSSLYSFFQPVIYY